MYYSITWLSTFVVSYFDIFTPIFEDNLSNCHKKSVSFILSSFDIFILHLRHLADAFIQSNLQYVHLSEERETTIYCCRYSKDVHRTKCQAPTIARLIHSPYATKIARIRCYTMLSTILKCKVIQHTISVDIKCQDVQHTISWITAVNQGLYCLPRNPHRRRHFLVCNPPSSFLSEFHSFSTSLSVGHCVVERNWKRTSDTSIEGLPYRGFRASCSTGRLKVMETETHRFRLWLHVCHALTHTEELRQKKKKRQYMAVGTVRMFIKPSAKHLQLLA